MIVVRLSAETGVSVLTYPPFLLLICRNRNVPLSNEAVSLVLRKPIEKRQI
jgi:hypothetical protein